MGNSGSQPEASEQASVFSLSEELQEQMAQEYNNEQVVKLFGKQMEKLGERKAEVIKAKLEQRTHLEQHMEQFRAQNNQVQKQLDQNIESFEDRFTDTANVVEYDVERLEKKYLRGKLKDSTSIPCLAERSDIAACYQKSKAPNNACDVFIESLTECAARTITTK